MFMAEQHKYINLVTLVPKQVFLGKICGHLKK